MNENLEDISLETRQKMAAQFNVPVAVVDARWTAFFEAYDALDLLCPGDPNLNAANWFRDLYPGQEASNTMQNAEQKAEMIVKDLKRRREDIKNKVPQ